MLEDSMFGDIFNGFFDRDFYESAKYKAYYNKDKTKIIFVFNTLGISADDIKVNFDKDVMHVVGKTKVEETGATNSVDYKLRLDMQEYKGFEFDSRDGYTYVYATLAEAPKKVEVKRIER